MQSGSSQRSKEIVGCETSKPMLFKPIIKEEVDEDDGKLKIDLDKIATMDPDTEMMSYVSNLSINYEMWYSESNIRLLVPGQEYLVSVEQVSK